MMLIIVTSTIHGVNDSSILYYNVLIEVTSVNNNNICNTGCDKSNICNSVYKCAKSNPVKTFKP